MEFRRINGLPPYVFATIDSLKLEARRAGKDVIDLGFGNPDLPSPSVAVDKLAEAAHNPRNHRYSSSKGIPKLRQAISDLYSRTFGVEVDPESEVVTTIGAKEGLSHLMWVLLGPGDTAFVPSPSYPIHIYAPLFAGADIRQVPLHGPGSTAGSEAGSGALDPGDAFFDSLMETWESTWPKPRVIVLSFPHNPTTACVEYGFMERLVGFAREHEVVLVHDFAYADIGFDGYRPPSILQVPGAKDVAVELYTMTKSFSMAGWRVGFMLGNAAIIQALTKLKSYLDYGTFQPIQIAAIVAMNEASDYPNQIRDCYEIRRNTLCNGLSRIGWEVTPPRGTMFVWARLPEPYREMGSLEFAKLLVRDAEVATSPGVGFGPGGDGHVRFALIENEQRTLQAVRNLRRALTKLG
ncbi:MAG: aminotransferase class I/II-fold pyridoxal phosphate-dependent enzyme [Actinomycetota bacterium]|jgi:alanine-synthesizing transaminase|nr:aminotransferase class I/II-fold pyridoxal phosphate-dependent enzyme [Actinomycetota bacterium]